MSENVLLLLDRSKDVLLTVTYSRTYIGFAAALSFSFSGDWEMHLYVLGGIRPLRVNITTSTGSLSACMHLNHAMCSANSLQAHCLLCGYEDFYTATPVSLLLRLHFLNFLLIGGMRCAWLVLMLVVLGSGLIEGCHQICGSRKTADAIGCFYESTMAPILDCNGAPPELSCSHHSSW